MAITQRFVASLLTPCLVSLTLSASASFSAILLLFSSRDAFESESRSLCDSVEVRAALVVCDER